MVAFQTLGELSTYLDTRPGVEIVDPGEPLTEWITGEVASTETLRKHPSVRKVTGFIARAVSTVPLHVYERVSDTDRLRVTDHELVRALGEPTARMTQARFLYDLMIDRLLYDRFCAIWSYKRGKLTLTRIPAKRIKFRTDGISGIETVNVWGGKGGPPIEVDPKQCILDVGYSPRGASGLSPITTLENILKESTEAIEYRRQVWRNGARVPQVIERPLDAPSWTREARSRFQRSMAEFRGDSAKAGGFPLLEDGMTIAQVTSYRPRDTQDLEGRRLTDAEVAAAYFVPPELVGAREGNYSNIESFRQMIYGEVAGPWIVGIEQAFNVMLVPEVAAGRPLYVEANLEAKLRGSFLDQAKVGQTAVGAPTMTRNEWRARMNLPAVDGGDELITPLNVIEGGQASPNDVEGRPAE